MAAFESSDKIRLWRYAVKQITFVTDNDKFNIPKERIISMNIEENYEKNIYPLFDVEISLEASRYYKIIKNKNICKLYIRIDKYYQTQNSEKKSSYYPFINDNFVIIMDKDNDDILNTLKQREAKSNFKSRIKNDVNNLEYTEASILHLYLFKPVIVDAMKTNINVNLYRASVIDAIGYIMRKLRLDHLLMAKPDNTDIIDQLFIPALPAIDALKFIDGYYGIYRVGSIIFLGFKHNIIVPFNGKCVAYTSNEIRNVTIIVPSAGIVDEGHTDSTGDLHKRNDNKTHYIVANYKTLEHKNSSISNNYIFGNDVKIVDSYNGNAKISNSSAKARNKNHIKIEVAESSSKYISSIYTARTNSMSDVFIITAGSINISDIAPNKRYTLVFEDSSLNSKYKGNYILTYAYHEFIRDGDDFSENTHLVLKIDKS